MTRSLITFAAAFVLGSIVALVARTVAFDPESQAAVNVAPTESSALAHEHHAQVSAVAESSPVAEQPRPEASADALPVNTICAICGMEVDPALPTAEYAGKRIGFGCRMCPPKFRADPERYGPHYLKNEVIPR